MQLFVDMARHVLVLGRAAEDDILFRLLRELLNGLHMRAIHGFREGVQVVPGEVPGQAELREDDYLPIGPLDDVSHPLQVPILVPELTGYLRQCDPDGGHRRE
jgi:hypothetical protein